MHLYDFIDIYWRHYLLLEKDFLSTQRYVALDSMNSKTYSDEYMKQYQSIGSEIDVFAKEFCKLLSSIDDDNIHKYCKTITDNFPDFSNEKIYVRYIEKYIQPWQDWKYKITTDKNGKNRVTATVPKWWTMYNKTKHQRTTALVSYGNVPFYKFANQENLINALGALYYLELRCYLYLLKNAMRLSIGDYIIEDSRLFFIDKLKPVNEGGHYLLYDYDGLKVAIKDR